MTFNDAYAALSKLVAEIEDDSIKLDSLAVKIREANQLIAFCETQLRVVEDDVAGALGGSHTQILEVGE